MTWINVKDQMPDPGQFVLAFGEACQGWVGGPKIAVFRWYADDWYDANMDCERVDYYGPTHWMPLPNPPHEG